MARRSILGLYRDAQSAAAATEALRQAGFSNREYDIMSGSPYPEGAFGEHDPGHRLFVFPLIGAMCGFATGLLITAGTQIAFPMVTGGKPLLSIPPMLIIMYEGTMLGALLFTVLGVIFESRLPRGLGLYDPRITEGYIGVTADVPEERFADAERALQQAGAVELLREGQGTSRPATAS